MDYLKKPSWFFFYLFVIHSSCRHKNNVCKTCLPILMLFENQQTHFNDKKKPLFMKVSIFRNVFLVSSILPKNKRKNLTSIKIFSDLSGLSMCISKRIMWIISKSHHDFFCIFSPHQKLKNVVKSSKHFVGYFNSLEWQGGLLKKEKKFSIKTKN